MDYELVVCEKCHAEHNGYSEGSEDPYSTTYSGSMALEQRVLPHTGPRWHTKCRRCGCQSATHDVVYENPATKHSEGSRRMHSSCKYCGKEDSWTETIPRIVETRSSSSSSGDFGGGSSSGGGGASSSW